MAQDLQQNRAVSAPLYGDTSREEKQDLPTLFEVASAFLVRDIVEPQSAFRLDVKSAQKGERQFVFSSSVQ